MERRISPDSSADTWPDDVSVALLDDASALDSGWVVVVYDNPLNTWEEVIRVLLLATRCTEEEAYAETWEIHHLGKSVVHHGEESECVRVASIIAKIGIRVEVYQE